MKYKNVLVGFIWASIVIGGIGMLFPFLGSTFSPYYGSIAKHIVLTNNWSDLMLSGHDWLDKPHFPFWITAISFKIFGINAFAYILPGFIFNLIGTLYTYKLAKLWYDNMVALVATLFYLTCLHLMLSAIDVRAEAYLLGEIIPACYYLLLYDRTKTLKSLILSAIFSALAMMTKGIFIIVTIGSGFICLWIYQHRLTNIFDYRWWLVIFLSLFLITPEIISLYIQFDMHPEKVIFGRTHVSGIKWFFWDSQFGRFFNTGPIAASNPAPFHWLFFVHTFLWAFLPWWPIFFAALWNVIRHRKRVNNKDAEVYFLGSFFTTFILFSATSFQVDHYTNIIFPFACIISAKWFIDQYNQNRTCLIDYIQVSITVLILLATFVASYFAFIGVMFWLTTAIIVIVVIALQIVKQKYGSFKAILYPVISMFGLFIIVMCVNGLEYVKYDVGYQIAKALNNKVHANIVGYKMSDVPLKSLDFYTKNNYISIDDLNCLPDNSSIFYIVAPIQEISKIKQRFRSASVYMEFSGCEIGPFLSNLISKDKLKKNLIKYVVMKVS